jgi:hypothetical protein
VESKYRHADSDGRKYRKDNCLNQNKDRPNLTFEWNGHSSNQGDLVADFFCGSGTTAAVAEKCWGANGLPPILGKFAIHTTRKRLIGVQREKKAAEQDFRAFEVLNLGRYERQAYLNVGGRLTGTQKAQALAQKESEFRELILRAYKATGFGGNEGAQAQDGFFHGARNGRLVVIGPINLPVGRLFVEEVITECRKRGASRVDVLAFEFEMGLFPAVLEEARSKGIDLAPKYIPPKSSTSEPWTKARWSSTTSALSRPRHATTRRTSSRSSYRADGLLGLLHAGHSGSGDCRHEGRQERGHVRTGTALQGEQEQGRHRHKRASDEALDGLGGLLGRGLRLHAAQGDHQGARGVWPRRLSLRCLALNRRRVK